ncbi:MAG: T9SS type A sorting domain-containing protein, partial [Sphingobacteriales bacterium]
IIFRPGANVARIGINVNAAADYKILENTISMASNLNNWRGISATGCTSTSSTDNSNSFLLCRNLITGDGLDFTSASEQAAIYNETYGGRLEFNCNNVTGTKGGLFFRGTGTQRVQGNILGTHRNALHVANNSQIGTQRHRGNQWTAAPANGSGGSNAQNDNALPQNNNQQLVGFSRFIVHPNSFWPIGAIIPANWFDPQGYNNNESTYLCGTSCPIDTSVPDPCCFDRPSGIDSIQNEPYTDETLYAMQRGLYEQIDSDPVLLNDAEMAAFYEQMQEQLAGQYHEINKERLSIYNLDGMVEAQLETNKAQLETLMHNLDSLNQLMNSGSLSHQDAVVTAAAIAGTITSITTLANYNKVALELAQNQRTLTAENIKAVNEALGTGNQIEENERAVNSIYLSTIAKGEALDPAYAPQLYLIATQCPMSGGNAVFRARALYSVLSDTVEYNDRVVCLQQGVVLRKKQPANLVKVYPNPASDKATIEYKLTEEAIGTLVLFNTLGQEITRFSLPAHSGAFDFSTSEFAQAVYFYKVYSSGNPIGSGKLSIMR